MFFKKLLPFVVLAILTTAAFGQTRLNIKVGTNIMAFSDNYDDGTFEGQLGYQAGFDIRFGDNFYIAPGAYFFSQRSRVKTVGIDDVVSGPSFDLELRGINIPIMIGGDLIEDEDWALRIYGGPNASFLIDENSSFLGYEDDDTFEDVMWGATAGIGFDFDIFTIDLSQEFRINDTFRDDTVTLRNHVTSLSIGLLF